MKALFGSRTDLETYSEEFSITGAFCMVLGPQDKGDDENVYLFFSNSLVYNGLPIQLENVHYKNVQ